MRVHEIKDYDLALSFAGEDREYVERVASVLTRRAVRVFYDRDETHNLLGRDMGAYLDQIYQHRAHFVVVFLSEAYIRKAWTKHEFRSILAGRVLGREDYILPIMLSDVELPGLPPTTGYIDASALSPESVASVLIKKLFASGVRRPRANIIEGSGLVAWQEIFFRIDRRVVGRHGYSNILLFSTTTDLFVLANRPRSWKWGDMGGAERDVEIVNLVTLETQTMKFYREGKSPHYGDRETLTEPDSPWITYVYPDRHNPLPFQASQILVAEHSGEEWRHPAGLTRVVPHYLWEENEPGVRTLESSMTVYLDRLDGVVNIPLYDRLLDLAISADGMTLGAVTLGEYFGGDPDYSDDLPSRQDVNFTIHQIQALPGR
jgi:hypothetical protein